MTLSMRVHGEGRPVVFLPWFGTSQAFMAAACEPAFAGTHGWQRSYVDLPGTGASPPVEARSDAVLDAVERSLGATRFLLAGCSYGGYLAAGLTRRIPGRVAGLLLVCAGVSIRPEQRNLAGVLPSAPEPGWLAPVPEWLHTHFEHAVGTQTRAVAHRIAAAYAGDGRSDDAYLETLRAHGYPLADEDSPDRFDGPVTIVASRRDRVAGYLDQFDALVRHGRADYVAIAEAGHYLPFEAPERFATIIRDWLAKSVDGPAGGR